MKISSFSFSTASAKHEEFSSVPSHRLTQPTHPIATSNHPNRTVDATRYANNNGSFLAVCRK
jgi:hypothetical protein